MEARSSKARNSQSRSSSNRPGGQVQQTTYKRNTGREIAGRRKEKNKGCGGRKTDNGGCATAAAHRPPPRFPLSADNCGRFKVEANAAAKADWQGHRKRRRGALYK